MKLQLSLLSIFLTSLLSGSAVTPMLPAMAEHFHSIAITRIFLSLPSLVIIPFLFFSGTLEHFFSKKKLILFGLYLYVISGLISLFIDNIWLLLFLRALTGVGAGFVIPYSASLVSDYFNGEQRDKVLGYTSVMVYSGGVFILLISGFLVSIYWKLCFLINLVALVPLYLITVNLPTVTYVYKMHKIPYILKIVFKRIVYQASAAYFFAILLVFSYFTNISFLITEQHLGGPGQSSIAQSVFMFAGALSNLLMNLVRKTNNSHLLLHSVQVSFMALGFFLLGLPADHIWWIYIGSFIIGIGYGSYGNTLVSTVSANTSRLNRVNALGFLLSSLYIGQFLSNFFVHMIMDYLNTNSYRVLFLVEGLVFILAALILVIVYNKKRGKRELPDHFTLVP